MSGGLYQPGECTDVVCALGEAPLWNHLIQRLFWFDILSRKLHSCTARGEGVRTYDLPTRASAAMLAGPDRLLIATERGLDFLDLASGETQPFVSIEETDPRTRSNDGRGAPDGSFYTSTMGIYAEEGLGSMYQVTPDGAVRTVLEGMTIPNSLAWSLDGRSMFYTDSPRSVLRRCSNFIGGLHGDEPVFHDLRSVDYVADGAVIDAEDHLWVGHWDGGEIVRLDPDGKVVRRVPLPTSRPTRAAFGGSDLRTLFLTTAVGDLGDDPLEEGGAGRLYAMQVEVPGTIEPVFGLSG